MQGSDCKATVDRYVNPGVRATIEDNILTRQVACVGAAKERGKGTKLFRLAKTTRGNHAAHAKRLILGGMARRSCRKFEVLA